jgi:hypothetical protein
MCSAAYVSVTDVVWLSWANVYPSKYLQVPGSCVSCYRMKHIYTFDANIVIIVKFIYLAVFTYFFVNTLFTMYIFITGIFNKFVLTAQITYGGETRESREVLSSLEWIVGCDFKKLSRNVVQEVCDNVQKLSWRQIINRQIFWARNLWTTTPNRLRLTNLNYEMRRRLPSGNACYWTIQLKNLLLYNLFRKT